MAHVIEVEVTVGRTINMGNFEFLRLEEALRIRLNEEDDHVVVRNDALSSLEAKVDADAKVIAKRIRGRK